MKQITIYCDGSSLGNPGPGGWCGILMYKDKYKIVSGAETYTTSNRMELSALIYSLKALKEPCEVTIYTDSRYVCDGINLWLTNWIKKHFKDVKNIDLWRMYMDVSNTHKIEVHWIKGHSGHPYNEQCDKIAKEEAKRCKNSPNSTIQTTSSIKTLDTLF